MGIIKYWDEKVKKLSWIDVEMTQWSAMIFGIMLVIWFPGLLRVNIWILAILAIALVIRPFYKAFMKK